MVQQSLRSSFHGLERPADALDLLFSLPAERDERAPTVFRVDPRLDQFKRAQVFYPHDHQRMGLPQQCCYLGNAQWSVRIQHEQRGDRARRRAKAMEVADATAEIILSNFREGYDALESVRARYSGESWFEHVRGNVSFFILDTPAEDVREKGPLLLASVPANYDPMPVLRNLDVPQLWLLGEDDTDAPIAETLRRLRMSSDEGRPIEVVVYPDAGHGIYEYEASEDGTRLSTRNPEGYFTRMRDFILHGPSHIERSATIHQAAEKF